MKHVQGANFGVRFYRRGVAKTQNLKTAKDTPRQEGAMEENDLIETTIPEASRQLWQSAWAPMVNAAAPQEERPVYENRTDEEQQAMLRQIAAMAKEAYDRVLRSRAQDHVENKEQLLWAAARKGDVYKIRLLVMDGADLDARDAHGRTAINIAMQYNQQGAIKTLMAAKEMRRMAKLGDLPETRFFQKFKKQAV